MYLSNYIILRLYGTIRVFQLFFHAFLGFQGICLLGNQGEFRLLGFVAHPRSGSVGLVCLCGWCVSPATIINIIIINHTPKTLLQCGQYAKCWVIVNTVDITSASCSSSSSSSSDCLSTVGWPLSITTLRENPKDTYMYIFF